MMSNSTETHPIDSVGKNPAWVAFIEDESAREILNQIALKDALPLACIQTSDSTLIRAFLTSGIEPRVVIFDLTHSTDLIRDAKTSMSYCLPSASVIVIGKEDHISTFRDLKRVGVSDYLLLPLEEAEMRNAIKESSISASLNAEEPMSALKPFTVIVGARGGVGASTLSVNLASIIAFEFKKKICLIDLDLYNSSVCILLDLAQNAGLNDAITESDRLDEIFLKRLLIQKDENFSILTGQLGLEQEINFPVEPIRTLVTLLREKFDFIFADLPFSSLHTPYSQTILSMADHVIVVTDLSLVSIQALLRLRAFMSTYMPHLQCKIIANNLFPDGGTISEAMFEKSTNLILEDIFPYCKATMLEGVNMGEPFVKLHPTHAYSMHLRQFISTLFPQFKPSDKTKQSFFKRLWSKINERRK